MASNSKRSKLSLQKKKKKANILQDVLVWGSKQVVETLVSENEIPIISIRDSDVEDDDFARFFENITPATTVVASPPPLQPPTLLQYGGIEASLPPPPQPTTLLQYGGKNLELIRPVCSPPPSQAISQDPTDLQQFKIKSVRWLQNILSTYINSEKSEVSKVERLNNELAAANNNLQVARQNIKNTQNALRILDSLDI